MRLLRLQSEDSPLQRQARLIVERQVGQLTHLVDDLLEISRITSGRIRLRLEGLDVRGVVERAVEGVQGFIAERHHRLSVRLPEQPLWLEVDAGRLEQVLVNLLHNASKYTDEGGHIELSVSEAEEHVVIRVRDNGIGIEPQYLKQVFVPFKRLHGRQIPGNGIGLAVCQRIIEAHGGRLWAESELNVGSEFCFALPVTAA